MNEQYLKDLYQKYFGSPATAVHRLPGHASARQLARLSGEAGCCIGVAFSNMKENRTFIAFAQTFLREGFRVPEVLIVSPCETFYLISDLGADTLFDVLTQARGASDEFPAAVVPLYKEALAQLVQFQTVGARAIDFSLCCYDTVYGARGMHYDMNAFANDYLKRIGISFDEDRYRADCESFVEFLLQSPPDYFMYRDFQSRNIMVADGALGFVDFQGGRWGPLQYDVVSLLYQSQARIPAALREELVAYYLDELQAVQGVSEKEFFSLFDGYVLLRLYQVLATYGREGLGNGKEYFLNGIPRALHLLQEVIATRGLPVQLPELQAVTEQAITTEVP